MPVVGGGDHDGIDSFVVEHLAEILHRLRRPAILYLAHRCGGCFCPVDINIGHPSDLTVGASGKFVAQVSTAPPHADDPERDFIIGRGGPDGLGVRQDCRADGQTNPGLRSTI